MYTVYTHFNISLSTVYSYSIDYLYTVYSYSIVLFSNVYVYFIGSLYIVYSYSLDSLSHVYRLLSYCIVHCLEFLYQSLFNVNGYSLMLYLLFTVSILISVFSLQLF